MAELLLRWRSALAIAIVAAAAATFGEGRRICQIQAVSFTMVPPLCTTPSTPGLPDSCRVINAIPSPDWNVVDGRGRFEAKTEKSMDIITRSFIPSSSDDDAIDACRTEAARRVSEFNTLAADDLERAGRMFDARIMAIDASVAEVSALAHDRNGNPDTVLLTRQLAELRERRATLEAERTALQGARILGAENVVRKQPLAPLPVVGALAGFGAFAASLVVLSFCGNVLEAYRQASARNG